jgi:polysaccharide pyruvyl transferase WcaK-like protein
VYGNSLSKQEVEKYVDAHAKALDAAAKKHGFDVVFIPHYITGLSGDDLDISKSIMEKMEQKQNTKIIITQDVSEFKLTLDKMSMIISSKMHPAILVSTGFVPILCIVYDHKQTGFFKRLNMEDNTLNIRAVTADSLLAKIDITWARRDQLRISLERQIPLWQSDVQNAIKKIFSLYFK